MRISHITAAIAAAFTLMATTTHAITREVSGGGNNLQTVINNSSLGDILLVGPGTYNPINTGSRNIRIESTGGAGVACISVLKKCVFENTGMRH